MTEAKQVIVEVIGGVAVPTKIPKGIEVVIRDVDVGSKQTFTTNTKK